MKTKLIGIAGKVNAGKDTVASQIAINYGYLTNTFAAPLKVAASKIFGLPLDFFVDRDKKDTVLLGWGKTPRQLIVQLADTLKAQFGEELFVKAWLAETLPLLEKETPIVVSDVRLQIEVEAVKRLGGVVVYVHRPGVEQGSVGDHVTEAFDPTWADYQVINDSDRAALWLKVNNLMVVINS